MDDLARDLKAAFVAALRPHLEARLAECGWTIPDTEVAAAEALLEEALDELLALPFREQRRGPLEVFQEAMAGPTIALERMGATPIDRDPAARSALPGDLFGLAPASSAELGDEAWRAHLAWGVAKAAAATGPAVGVVSANLLDLDRIERALPGRRVLRVGPDADLGGLAAVFVDLEHADADAMIAAGAVARVRVVAYGPHVDDLALVRARSLGASTVLPRSRFFRDPASQVPAVV